MADMSSQAVTDAEDVARGAAWLDERIGSWWLGVDIESLWMMDTRQCILGQTFGEDKYIELFEEQDAQWIVRHGFAGGKDWWIQEILERRNAA